MEATITCPQHPSPFSSVLLFCLLFVWLGLCSVNNREEDRTLSRLKQFDAVENDAFDTMSATQPFSQLCLKRTCGHWSLQALQAALQLEPVWSPMPHMHQFVMQNPFPRHAEGEKCSAHKKQRASDRYLTNSNWNLYLITISQVTNTAPPILIIPVPCLGKSLLPKPSYLKKRHLVQDKSLLAACSPLIAR